MPKEWQELTRREKTERQRESFKTGVRERVDALTGGGMDRDNALSKAGRDQEITSNRAWATYERRDGHK